MGLFLIIKTMLTTISIIAITVLGMVLYLNQLTLPEIDITKYRKPGKKLKVLSLFPHPDDETMNIGGSLAKWAAMPDVGVKVVSVTKGEAGETNGVCEPPQLGTVREQELSTAMKHLGITDVELWDLPDGFVSDYQEKLKQKLQDLFTSYQPDVVITYDGSGLYGHPDHIVLSLVTTHLLQKEFLDIKLLYATLPKRLVRSSDLPKTINLYGKDVTLDNVQLKHTLPKFKSLTWLQAAKKYRAIRSHRSQKLGKGIPFPLWLFVILMGTEYFSEGN